MPEPISLAIVTALVAKNAPSWLDALRGVIFDKGREALIEKGKELVAGKGGEYGRRMFHLDEKEQQRHLEQALKNAVERGVARFQTLPEQGQYRDVLKILCEPGAHSEALRREALRLLTLSETPDLAELNEAYNRSIRIRNLRKATPPAEVDAAPYLSSFFDALIAELYADPFFKQQMSDMLQLRVAKNMQISLEEVVSTLRQISDQLAEDYTAEQFAHDVETYTAHIERTLHNLKIVGVVPKDRGEKNPDPELNGIFVPLRIKVREQRHVVEAEEKQDVIIDLLEQHPYVVLLGGPGSGKSTAVRHLAWSHAATNLSSSPATLPLLGGNPLPLRIELRRLSADRRSHPDYNFLSYATEVLLEREGVQIQQQMFEELLKRRAMLLLFDGLDEVATLAERSQLVEEIGGCFENCGFWGGGKF